MSLRSAFIRLAFLCLVLFGHLARADVPTILVMGDSLSAAYGMRVEQGWVTLLQQRLESEGYGYRVVNASESGETTGGALARLPRALDRHQPAVVIIELGGNDGLRGLPTGGVQANLESMVRLSRKSGARVLLIGMRIPPNYGPAYTKSFHELFAQVASSEQVPLVPFFLDGIALDEGLMQDDGLHPNAAAQPKLLAQVWPLLAPLLKK
ncbi:MAG: arylesterase [Steroidobacteraceae bacterium]|nr:arylesterase [Steroidobacteraceae bacterium]